MRLENAKNYSPEVSILMEMRAKKLKNPLPENEETAASIPQLTFRDRLVDFLMYPTLT
jgi:hypothetical protein